MDLHVAHSYTEHVFSNPLCASAPQRTSRPSPKAKAKSKSDSQRPNLSHCLAHHPLPFYTLSLADTTLFIHWSSLPLSFKSACRICLASVPLATVWHGTTLRNTWIIAQDYYILQYINKKNKKQEQMYINIQYFIP